MSVTIEDIEALRRVLAELPRHQPKEVSKQEAIALLSTELGAARRRGYRPEELARILSERGVAINVATLRGYLRRNRKGRSGHESKAGNEQGGTLAPAAATTDGRPAVRPTSAAGLELVPPPKAQATADAIPSARGPAGGQAAGIPGARPSPEVAVDRNAQPVRK